MKRNILKLFVLFIALVAQQTIAQDEGNAVQTDTTANIHGGHAQADQHELEEVVVTALGIKRERKSLGYSSQSVDAEQVSSVPTVNFVNNLSGKVAGLNITQGTNFGGSTNVVLRGFKSISGDNQALFVIDGIPILNSNVNPTTQKSGRSGFDLGNTASDINPNDVAEINILKGAAATALYGSRAQNGAIIITTKKGKLGKGLMVDFSSSYTSSTVNNETFPTYQTEYGGGYMGVFDTNSKGENQANFGDDASYGPRYDNSKIWQYDAYIPGSPNFDKKTAWAIAANGPITFFQRGETFVNNLALSGGSEKASYNFSVGNITGTDVLPETKLEKNNFSFSTTYNFNDKLSSTVNAAYVYQNVKGRNSTGYNKNIMTEFRQWWPTNVDLKQQKEFYEMSEQNYSWNINSPDNLRPVFADNPYFARYESYQTDSRKRFTGNMSLNYQIHKDINLMLRAGTDGYTLTAKERRAVGSVAGLIGLQQSASQPSGYALSLYDESEQNFDFLATYNKSVTDDFKISALVGTNFNVQNKFSERQTTSGGLIIPGIYTISNSVAAPYLPEIKETKKQIFGAFGQVTLDWKDTYYLEGSLRRDESSALPTNNNSYWYGSGTASFVFSGLDIIKEIPAINFGKFRIAYAQVGSDTDPNLLYDEYNAEPAFTTGRYALTTTAKSANLKPQRLDNSEIGGEMQFLKNRIGFDVAWFQNTAFDQILAVPVSTSTGYSYNYQNAGTLTTKGWEVTFNATPIKLADFAWNLSLNWSNPLTKVTALAPGVDNIVLSSSQGGVTINAPLNQPYGTIQGKDFVYDPDGNRVIDASSGAYLSTAESTKNLGTYQADWIGGLNNKFTYKDLSFSFLIDMKKGGKVFSLDQYYGYGTGLYPDSVGLNDLGYPVRNTLQTGGGEVLKGVVKNSDGSYSPNTVRLDRSQSSQVLNTDPPLAAFIYDAGFVKLREVVLSYSVPQSFLGKHINGVSLSVIGNNLWIIKKYIPYSDPEAGLSAGNVQGNQSGPMPATKNVSFNLKLKF